MPYIVPVDRAFYSIQTHVSMYLKPFTIQRWIQAGHTKAYPLNNNIEHLSFILSAAMHTAIHANLMRGYEPNYYLKIWKEEEHNSGERH